MTNGSCPTISRECYFGTELYNFDVWSSCRWHKVTLCIFQANASQKMNGNATIHFWCGVLTYEQSHDTRLKSYPLNSLRLRYRDFTLVQAICEKIWHFGVQAWNFVRLCLWSLPIILDMFPGKFHPLDKMAAILLTPLPENRIFVISSSIFNTSLILKYLYPGFHGQQTCWCNSKV